MLGNFSEETQLVLMKARDEMLELNHPYIGTEHLVLSILKNDDDLSLRLKDYGLTYDSFKKEILEVIGRGSKKSKFFLHTPLLKKVMENAILDAKDNHHGEVTVDHLFSCLLEEGEGIAIRIFIGMGIDVDEMYDRFSSRFVKKTKKKKKLLIDELGVDLVQKAKTVGFDPVVGREKEIQRLIEILCRRGKNNPVLIGEAGVGKTAIVEELSSLIASSSVPLALQNKRIISLDMASVVSGTKYRGEFEERMQKLIKEVSSDGNIILFIDEIHTLVGAGGAEGAIDASNILKPALARGDIHCIGATTIFEYKKYIEEDKALERRFQKIVVSEVNRDETVHILEKLRSIYEQYHHVIIPEGVLKSIVDLSNQYIFDRYQPDKAIDILDEVCSMVSIRETKEEEKFCLLKKKLLEVQKKKNAFILDSDVKKAYGYLKKEDSLMNEIHHLELSFQKIDKKIEMKDVALVIHEKSGVPIYEIMKDDEEGIQKINDGLRNMFYGQGEAISSLVNASKKIRLGYSNHKIESFLFVGPTGVGKTAIAKKYASLLVGENNFIRLDMSEFSDATSVNKFIGSSPGYVGYQDQYSVLSKLKDKPCSVLLLDEVDKAHPSVLNLLYQILDEGKIKDARNQVIQMNHNMVIMTSNLGFESNKVGFCSENRSHVMGELKQKFPVSLLNRIHHIIIFPRLNYDDVYCIVKRRLDLLKKKYSHFKYSSSLVKEIIEESHYLEYGARKLENIIDSKVENLIIDRLLRGDELVIHHLNEVEKTIS